MKIIITESQFKRLIENIIKEEKSDVVKDLEKRWAMEDEFRKIMKDVIEKENPLNLDIIFYVDKNDPTEIYMEYDQTSRYVWINYEKLWSVFESKYGLNYQKTKDFFKGILKRDYNLRGVTPVNTQFSHLPGLKRDYNLRGVTPKLLKIL